MIAKLVDEEAFKIKKWYAVHTRSHHEKNVSLRLEGRGVESFCPVRSVMRKWKDRKKMVDFPLFPGYIFVHMPLLQKRDVVQTPGVVKIVGTREPEPMPESQIIAVKQFLDAEIQFDPYPYLVPGIEVEVIRGPLKHVRGVLESKKNKHRLVINIELINNCVSTEIDAADVQAV